MNSSIDGGSKLPIEARDGSSQSTGIDVRGTVLVFHQFHVNLQSVIFLLNTCYSISNKTSSNHISVEPKR